jgi:dihydroxyacid dehydratase/phosphogluconate dehydratase
LGAVLDAWRASQRRERFRQRLRELDGVDPDDVILSPAQARERGMTSTVAFPRGNLAPEGALIKSTALDPAVVDAGGVFRHEGVATVFTSEGSAMQAVKAGRIRAGDIMVLVGIGPLGTGMEETAQITIALKHLPFGNRVTLITDGRFSGVSTGACIGHVGPEALAGGPIGKVRDGDRIRVGIDCNHLAGSLDLVGEGERRFSPAEGAAVLAARALRDDLAPHPALPDDTRLWALLQQTGGGTWGGCVYDLAALAARLA